MDSQVHFRVGANHFPERALAVRGKRQLRSFSVYSCRMGRFGKAM